MMERIAANTCFGGRQEVWQHQSQTLACTMKLGVYLPPAALAGRVCHVLYWLSGLTCSEQNFITKAGAQAYAARHDLILVAPDTSPRGETVANDPAYDLGQGAGFYVNATEAPWSAHYRMQDYIAQELPALIEETFCTSGKRSISGHSMGGHGALVTALRHPGRYASVSAFAPIVAPASAPWGRKAFTAYLGPDEAAWQAWDAVELLKKVTPGFKVLVDQGKNDEFLEVQLRPQLLQAVSTQHGHDLTLRVHDGYDHSYYFIASFIEDHIAYHARALQAVQAGSE